MEWEFEGYLQLSCILPLFLLFHCLFPLFLVSFLTPSCILSPFISRPFHSVLRTYLFLRLPFLSFPHLSFLRFLSFPSTFYSQLLSSDHSSNSLVSFTFFFLASLLPLSLFLFPPLSIPGFPRPLPQGVSSRSGSTLELIANKLLIELREESVPGAFWEWWW